VRERADERLRLGRTLGNDRDCAALDVRRGDEQQEYRRLEQVETDYLLHEVVGLAIIM